MASLQKTVLKNFDATTIQNGNHVNGREEKELCLVGSHLVELGGILNATASGSTPLNFNVSELQEIRKEYTESVVADLSEIFAQLRPISVQVLTGQQIFEHALRENPSLQNKAIVNLARHVFDIRHGVGALATQIDQLLEPEIIKWEAPVVDIETGVLRYAGMQLSKQSNIVGNGGRELSLQMAVDRAARILRHANCNELVFADDRTGEGFENLAEMSRLFQTRQFSTSAYIVGHASVPQFESMHGSDPARGVQYSNRGQKVSTVPLLAPRFQWNFGGERSFTGGVASEELINLGFFANAGHSVLKGYLGSSVPGQKERLGVFPELIDAYSILRDIYNPNTAVYCKDDFERLDELKVQINYPDRLIEVFDNLARAQRIFTLSEFHQLFIHSKGPILSFKGREYFNPETLDNIKVPLLWPGLPEERSLMAWLLTSGGRALNGKGIDYRLWGQFSMLQLKNTHEYLKSIEEATGSRVPASVLGFFGVPGIMQQLSPAVRESRLAVNYVEALYQEAKRLFDRRTVRRSYSSDGFANGEHSALFTSVGNVDEANEAGEVSPSTPDFAPFSWTAR